MDKRKDNVSQITKEEYKEKIMALVGQIEDENVLRKIFTTIKTHIRILNEKEGG